MITKMWHLVRHNLAIKLMSLCSAVVLWVVVMQEQNPSIENTYTIPISVMKAPDGYKISYSARSLKIRVRAPRSSFAMHDSTDFTAELNIEDLPEGSHSVPIKVVCPQGFELLEKTPENVDVLLDPYMEKQRETELIVTGTTANGTTVAEMTKDNAMVTVVGAKSDVSKVSYVIGYVALSGNDADFSVSVPLTAVDGDGHEVANVRVHPSSTTAHVTLARGLSKKVVRVEPIWEDLPMGYEVRSAIVVPAQVEIAGDEETLKTVNSIQTEPVPLGIATDAKRVVKLRPPAGITITNPEVTVAIDVEPVNSKPQDGQKTKKKDQ